MGNARFIKRGDYGFIQIKGDTKSDSLHHEELEPDAQGLEITLIHDRG